METTTLCRGCGLPVQPLAKNADARDDLRLLGQTMHYEGLCRCCAAEVLADTGGFAEPPGRTYRPIGERETDDVVLLARAIRVQVVVLA